MRLTTVVGVILVTLAALTSLFSSPTSAEPETRATAYRTVEYLRVIVEDSRGTKRDLVKNDPAVVWISTFPTTQQLNDFGRQGWELVLVTHLQEYVFRRSK
jgi:hypothetical protein